MEKNSTQSKILSACLMAYPFPEYKFQRSLLLFSAYLTKNP